MQAMAHGIGPLTSADEGFHHQIADTFGAASQSDLGWTEKGKYLNRGVTDAYAGLSSGVDGWFHGDWRGELHTDGERIADCSQPDVARRVHQIRDTVVRVRHGDHVGIGNFQTTIWGAWPDLGLDGDGSFT